MNNTFTPFNITCYNKLYEKFQFLFEPELINEICKTGMIKTYKEGSILMEIGQTLSHMPLVITGSVKVMKEDKEGNEIGRAHV